MKTRIVPLLILYLLLASVTASPGSADDGSRPASPTLSAAGPLTDEVTHVAVSPDFGHDRTIFAISRDAGTGRLHLYRSRDGGAAWEHLLDEGTTRVYVSPTFGTDGIVIVLEARLEPDPYNPGLVRRSTDGGDTWIDVYGPCPVMPWHLAFSPVFAIDHTLLLSLGGSNNLIASSDGGATFGPAPGHARARPNTPYGISTVAFSPDYGKDQTVFLGYYGGLARSSGFDSPYEWVYGGFEGGEVSIGDIAFSPRYATDHTMFITTSRAEYSLSGLYRSTDGGSNWARLDAFSHRPSDIMATPQALYALNGDVHRSPDLGDTWTVVARYWNSSALAADGSGRHVWAGTSQGLASSDDYGHTWIRPSDAVTATMPASGATITPTAGITITAATGALSDGTELRFTALQGTPPGCFGGGRVFELAAEGSGAGAVAAVAPGQALTVVVAYNDPGLSPEQEASLALRRRHGLMWSTDEIVSAVDTEANVLTATVQDLGTFGVLGTYQVALPVAVKPRRIW